MTRPSDAEVAALREDIQEALEHLELSNTSGRRQDAERMVDAAIKRFAAALEAAPPTPPTPFLSMDDEHPDEATRLRSLPFRMLAQRLTDAKPTPRQRTIVLKFGRGTAQTILNRAVEYAAPTLAEPSPSWEERVERVEGDRSTGIAFAASLRYSRKTKNRDEGTLRSLRREFIDKALRAAFPEMAPPEGA